MPPLASNVFARCAPLRGQTAAQMFLRLAVRARSHAIDIQGRLPRVRATAAITNVARCSATQELIHSPACTESFALEALAAGKDLDCFPSSAGWRAISSSRGKVADSFFAPQGSCMHFIPTYASPNPSFQRTAFGVR